MGSPKGCDVGQELGLDRQAGGFPLSDRFVQKSRESSRAVSNVTSGRIWIAKAIFPYSGPYFMSNLHLKVNYALI